ncbi:mRNA-capping enzyme subunit alpha [Pseudovirgaria hyperparasitica]|uniref:mRNA-capping enzyme subunit alpha n=1 Tax=Pseudovirgaria hyperparasitica TaxID=470096 RepID=A0A6A6WMG5_9PEZI|nr:mRNA-capping enzyme subunit alpha [Pseudovirgaria hyperparasitica]KAF2763394.1 mRNA-capping enzyme subunit alpha [Pseudovirgaria hyperparasitica]
MADGNGVPQIPGLQPPQEIVYHLRELIANVLGRGPTSFPGAQPVSFARAHLQELRKENYFMCEKTDGIRCLLWLDEDSEGGESCYLIDRKNDYYYLEGAHFPRSGDPTFEKFHQQTLLDGELVYDAVKTPQGIEKRLRFLVFDILVLEKESIMHKPLSGRLGRLRDYVTNPYNDWLKRYPEALSTQPFELKAKGMEFPYAMGVMFNEKLPNLEHGNDGLIFTCCNTSYKHGTDENIIKWKPPHENTIDFRLDLQQFPMIDPEDGEDGMIPDYDAIPTFSLLIGESANKFSEFGTLHLEPDEWESMKKLKQVLDGRIIECWRDDKGRWRFKREPDGSPRFRDDKDAPNHISTAHKVMASIRDGVTEMDLLKAETDIRREWKARAERKKREEEAARHAHAHARKHSLQREESEAKRIKTEA